MWCSTSNVVTIMEELHFNQNMSMFSQNYHFFLNTSILRRVVQEAQNWHSNFTRPSGFGVADKNMFWSTTPDPVQTAIFEFLRHFASGCLCYFWNCFDHCNFDLGCSLILHKLCFGFFSLQNDEIKHEETWWHLISHKIWIFLREIKSKIYEIIHTLNFPSVFYVTHHLLSAS